MRDFPTDPMLQHNRLIAAFCDDLFDICMNGKSGTPRSDAVCEISRQLARQDRANKGPELANNQLRSNSL